MHIVIGDKVFSVGDKTPLSKMNRKTPGAYSEVAVIGGARSDRIGRALETISISAKWLFDSAWDDVNDLREMIDTPQQVSDGQGRNLGVWTIKDIGESRESFINDGRAQRTNVDIELQEFRE